MKSPSEEPKYGRELGGRRNPIERFFGHVKRRRRIATRYEKQPKDDTGFCWLAARIIDRL